MTERPLRSQAWFGAEDLLGRLIHRSWQHKDGAWKITRVISYDHGPAPK